MPTVTVRTARKQYRCDGSGPDYEACTEPIEPGQRYQVVTVPPWEQHEPDVDDEGRTIDGGQIDGAGWVKLRAHVTCQVY